MNQNSQLRRTISQQRRKLSKQQQQMIESQCLKQCLQHPKFLQAKKIGVYLDAFGEVKTKRLIEYCFAQGKSVYLPMICNMNKILVWVKISHQQYRNQRFSLHPLGMREPMASRGRHISVLDVVIMPLLACDFKGTRMGMGGGFYDRTLASAFSRPHRLGLAHDFQFLDVQLNKNSWDQPLDSLITPAKTYYFKR
ncbi:5-formyltetrahydrofolate cyclo-ligase [Acinetobacter sp.]|jgi:5-formyltetrahydrofolate cyclo-ligase|uniref:5-formyltetrahydrofolate cyclo-ligase n=1 Tax=Acinetobacter sp. TaxID=472 RepID=UPI00281A4FBD|nr:5-formyltetrahydrofolate cyclo-ligase [Acinetobacter sp.]MDR0235441.1 5-formyltetrahydrofolate cyclo-ligase [Acinetobacter sp.]